MKKIQVTCICGWKGDTFEFHHKETELSNQCHIETSDLMNEFLKKQGA